MAARRLVYLDHAAATPLLPAAQQAMAPYQSTQFYNPSALYLAAKQVRAEVDGARQEVARLLGVRPTEIYFTSGATEANNFAIHGVLAAHPGKKLLISAIEHESVRLPAQQYDVAEIPVSRAGLLELDKLQQLLASDDVVLVSVMYANNEIGTVQPLRAVADVIQKIRRERAQRGVKTPLFLHSDAAQAGNYLPLHVNRLGVDMMTLNGGKIYGPKGSGVLSVRHGLRLKPQLFGGGQERGLRSGTEPVAAIVGFTAALKAAQADMKAEAKRLRALRQLLLADLATQGITFQLNGSLQQRLANNLSLTLPGVDNERLLMELDERGIMVATGSACSASSEEPSHVLAALGLTRAEIFSTIRLSMGRFTTEADIHYFVKNLAEILKQG